MRTHFTEHVPERAELMSLRNEYATVMKDIEVLQQENRNLMEILKQAEDNVSSDLDDDGMA